MLLSKNAVRLEQLVQGVQLYTMSKQTALEVHLEAENVHR